MKKIIIHSLITAMALGTTVTAFAEEAVQVEATGAVNTSMPLPKPPRPTVRTSAELKMKMSTTSERRDEMKDAMKARIASSTERREEMKDRMASSSERRQENREERREDRRELIKEKVENRFKKMFLRFQATINRETGIMNKINQRIAKVKEAGGTPTLAEKNTADAKKFLDEAQTQLNLLKATATSTTEIEAQLNASTTAPGQVTKATLEKLKNISDKIETNLKSAHKSLEMAVKNLRGMSGANATSTTSVNASSTTTTGSN